MNADRLGKLFALMTLATLALRYDVFVFFIDYTSTPVHAWMLAFAYLSYGGFGALAIVGLWRGKSWGSWTYYLHVLSGTINFRYAVIPFSPGFANDYLYYAWFLGGNVAACLAIFAITRSRERFAAL